MSDARPEYRTAGMIQTSYGNVALRSSRSITTRPQERVTLHGTGNTVTIKKNWLLEKELGGKEVIAANYRAYVVQVMSIAASQVALTDLSTKAALIDPETGQMRPSSQITVMKENLSRKLRGSKDGSLPVSTLHKGRMNVVKTVKSEYDTLTKNMLTKRSKKCGMAKTRYFDIHNGRLQVYRYAGKNAQVKHTFELSKVDAKKGVKCENSKTLDIAERFLPGWDHRVQLKVQGRIGPMYLYAKSLKQAMQWVDAVRMSKYIQSPQDKAAMLHIVGRVSGSQASSGWRELVCYATEMMTLQKSLKQFSLRFSKFEYTRGWHKAWLVYATRVEKEKKRKESEEYATRFLMEKMSRLGHQTARQAPLVRSQIITQIQTKFRHYRSAKIFDRAYPLGSSASSRVQQAQKGVPMTVDYSSMTHNEQMQIILSRSPAAMGTLKQSPDTFISRKATYSDVKVPIKLCNLNVADSLNMLCFTPIAVGYEHGSLSTAKWAQYVNLEQISSVVLHTDRALASNSDGGQELSTKEMGGVWANINGPRVSWLRRIENRIAKSGAVRTEAVGAQDGQALPLALLTGAGMRWLKVSVTAKKAIIPKVPDPMGKKGIKDEGNMPQNSAPDSTYMVLNILGRSFQSQLAVGESPVYPGQFVVDVPVSSDISSVAGLDLSPVSIDIMKYGSGVHTTVWAGSLPLWKLFSTDTSASIPGNDQDAPEGGVVSLAGLLNTGKAHAIKNVDLVHPTEYSNSQVTFGSVELEVTANITGEAPNTKPVSPELQGCGLLTTLYSTQRGAWYNPKLGPSVFNPNSVANFVELTLDSLTFPISDVADPNYLFKYHVEVVVNGVSTCTAPLVRARAGWAKVMKIEPGRILFEGTQILAPLPPGCWLEDSFKITINVIRQPLTEMPALNFAGLISAHGQNRQSGVVLEKVYKANVILDGMTADHPKHVSLSLGSARAAPVDIRLTAPDTADANACRLVVDTCLRDRDYARMSTADYKLDQRALFIGDAALILAEEPLMYPPSPEDFRKRMVPGAFDAAASKRGGRWSAQLRDPFLSHEYSESGLAKLNPPVQFKPKNIPGHFVDLLPYKFVLPDSEKEFQEQGKSGVFWRLADSFAALAAGKGSETGKPNVVDSMTHVVKKIPATMVAVYANKTCDVELASSFLHEWEQKENQYRQYTLPGSIIVSEVRAPAEAIKGAPGGGAAQPPQIVRRVLLKGVPISSLIAAHAASFNVYDAVLGSVEETIRAESKNTHNPREQQPSNFAQHSNFPQNGNTNNNAPADRRGGYNIRAGPVPIDAGPCCQYEWSLKIRADSEEDMYHFVTMLRQCVRMDHFQQVVRLRESLARPAVNVASNYDTGPTKSSYGGHLEVVLVEARRLQAKRVQKYQDLTERAWKALETDLSCYMNFVITNASPQKLFPEDHKVVEGETIRVIANGWERMKGFFTLDLMTADGRVDFRIWGRPDASGSAGQLVRTSMADPKTHEWGEQEAQGAWPFGGCNSHMLIDLTLNKVAWQVSINGKRCEAFDFKHRLPLEDRKQNRVVTIGFDGLVHPHIYLVGQREQLMYRGTMTQRSPTVGPSVSPNWARQDGLQGTGGWVFKTPEIDSVLMPHAIVEMQLMHQGPMGITKELGQLKLSITGQVPAEGGAPCVNLADPQSPFNNMWLPLSTPDPEHGKLVPNSTGEIHIMTRWVPNYMATTRAMPKTVRAFLMQELRPKLTNLQLREPVYDTQERLRGYNPNFWKVSFPQSRSESLALHAEQLYNSAPYNDCCQARQQQAWLDLEATLEEGDKAKTLVEIRSGSLTGMVSTPDDQTRIHRFDEALRRGIPPTWRMSKTVGIWSEITYATTVREQYAKSAPEAADLRECPELAYLALLESGRPIKSDAMLQLQEDIVTAASWESSKYPEVMDKHLERLRRAQSVCIALISFSYTQSSSQKVSVDVQEVTSGNQLRTATKAMTVPQLSSLKANNKLPGAVAYCESLLVIAFNLLLPQVDVSDPKNKNALPPSDQLFNRESFLTYRPGQTRSRLRISEEVQEESRAFWLLVTLICSPLNQEFADYFGTLPDDIDTRRNVLSDITAGGALQSQGTDRDGTKHRPIADTRGAMRDIFLLSCIVMRYQPDLFSHLSCLGFHLSTLFYGAFMRWFAFILPTATLFRLWDLIFSESTRQAFSSAPMLNGMSPIGVELSDERKPRRHTLIDFAYAVIKGCTTELMACESALEARDCLLNFMQALYDPSSVIEMIAEAETELWEGLVHEHLKVLPQFLNDFRTSEDWYQKFFVMFYVQNKVLNQLTSSVLVDLDARSRPANDARSTAAVVHDPKNTRADRRMTTKNVVHFVMSPLLNLFLTKGGVERKYCGMWRPTPKHIAEIGPVLDTTVQHKIMHFFGQAADLLGIHNEDMLRVRPKSLLHSGEVPGINLPGTAGEPTILGKQEWQQQVKSCLGSDWHLDLVNDIYDAFHKPVDSWTSGTAVTAGIAGGPEGSAERMSLNEFFLALVCCSKGTVGERALALFQIYAHNDKHWKLNHIVPVLHHSKAVVDRVEGSAEREKVKVFQPPDDADVPTTICLHFKVMCTMLKQEHLLGEVFVPSLHAYALAGMVRAQPESFTIWPPKKKQAAGIQGHAAPPSGSGTSLGAQGSHVRTGIGHVRMSIAWVSGDRPEMGQLCINIDHIKFEAQKLSTRYDGQVHKVNPWITLVTYDDKSQPKPITRWDPRSVARKSASALTLGMAYGGSFKGHLEWDETMRKDPSGHWLMSKDHTQKGHGWDAQEGVWKWSHKWGEQFSIEDFAVRKDSAAVSARANSISLKACRLITLHILRRSLAYVSNRQALLIADATFNRCGTVPGILDAVIVEGERILEQYSTIKQLKEDYSKNNKTFLDVRPQLMIEHERQVNDNLGELDLWAKEEGMVSLLKYDMKDPFPLSQKVLWIRYVRAGDGERQQVQIPVNGDGNFQPPRLKLDMDVMPGKVTKAQAQMSLTKEEFVACIQEQPLLSECLRQLTTREQSIANLPAWSPIKLDVTLTDPNKRYEDDELFDISNARQAILLEIWDHDLGKDDFLGECWLPSLGSMHAQPRTFVLPVRNMHTGSKTSTREDKGKHLADHVVCTGDLHVEASWKIPAQDVPPPPDSSATEAVALKLKREEIMHTGKLNLKILKANGIRSGDGGGLFGKSKKSADPYVIAYQLNEASGEWKHHRLTGSIEHILKTNVKKGTLQPEWNEAFSFDIMTGSFEQKIKQTQSMRPTFTNRQMKDHQTDMALSIFEQDEVRVYFGDEERASKRERGARHGVQIYLGDTIRQFKNKLLLACQKESDLETERSIALQYRSVKLSVRHVVTVFVPSDKLRSLFNQARNNAHEYKRMYKLEEQDPAFWQPLDPIRTFSNYAATYGFGLQIAGSPGQRDPAQRIRVAEATAEYKMRNQRFKHFEDEVNSCTVRVDETDEDKSCYGHGLYVHKNDGNSTEWRSALVERPHDTGDMKKRVFGVQWLYAFGGKNITDLEGHADLDEESVLLAPRLPKILGSGTLEHLQLLEQAADLRNSGLSDHDIVAKLNDKLKMKFQLAKQAVELSGTKSELMMPSPITLSELQHHFKRLEANDGAFSGSAAPPTNTEPAASSSPRAPLPLASNASPRTVDSGAGLGGLFGNIPTQGGGLMLDGGRPAASSGGMMRDGSSGYPDNRSGALRG